MPEWTVAVAVSLHLVAAQAISSARFGHDGVFKMADKKANIIADQNCGTTWRNKQRRKAF